MVIKTPPATTGLTSTATYTSKLSTIATSLYTGAAASDKSTSVAPTANSTVVPQVVPTTYYYARNNRIVGPFNSIAETQVAIDYHISRELEYGIDI